jgi:hypothetical protein
MRYPTYHASLQYTHALEEPLLKIGPRGPLLTLKRHTIMTFIGMHLYETMSL